MAHEPRLSLQSMAGHRDTLPDQHDVDDAATDAVIDDLFRDFLAGDADLVPHVTQHAAARQAPPFLRGILKRKYASDSDLHAVEDRPSRVKSRRVTWDKEPHEIFTFEREPTYDSQSSESSLDTLASMITSAHTCRPPSPCKLLEDRETGDYDALFNPGPPSLVTSNDSDDTDDDDADDPLGAMAKENKENRFVHVGVVDSEGYDVEGDADPPSPSPEALVSRDWVDPKASQISNSRAMLPEAFAFAIREDTPPASDQALHMPPTISSHTYDTSESKATGPCSGEQDADVEQDQEPVVDVTRTESPPSPTSEALMDDGQDDDLIINMRKGGSDWCYIAAAINQRLQEQRSDHRISVAAVYSRHTILSAQRAIAESPPENRIVPWTHDGARGYLGRNDSSGLSLKVRQFSEVEDRLLLTAMESARMSFWDRVAGVMNQKTKMSLTARDCEARYQML